MLRREVTKEHVTQTDVYFKEDFGRLSVLLNFQQSCIQPALDLSHPLRTPYKQPNSQTRLHISATVYTVGKAFTPLAIRLCIPLR